jgi:hypothetical protein
MLTVSEIFSGLVFSSLNKVAMFVVSPQEVLTTVNSVTDNLVCIYNLIKSFLLQVLYTFLFLISEFIVF